MSSNETPTPRSPFTLNLRDTIDALLDTPTEGNSQHAHPLQNDGGKPLLTLSRVSRAEDTPQDTLNPPVLEPPPALAMRTENPLSPRDAAAILHLARMRVLSYNQLARLVYVGVHKSVTRRRMRAMARQGWLHLWEKPTTSGGSPRYVYPSKRALAWATETTTRQLAGMPYARLIELMVPATPRQPWELKPGVTPLFLAHTEETNDLVIGWLRSALSVLWASSWDCPFPEHIEWRTLPQPDYVLIVNDGGETRLILGEHDRSTEPAREIASKLRVYSTWSQHPQLALATFGFTSFTVLITVSGRSPLRRVTQLAEVARAEGAVAFTRLSLASWAAADPTAAVWFRPDAPPTNSDTNPAFHALIGPLS